VPGFKEELDVYVADGELRADHAFWLFGCHSWCCATASAANLSQTRPRKPNHRRDL
jgi:hypothetical protein